MSGRFVIVKVGPRASYQAWYANSARIIAYTIVIAVYSPKKFEIDSKKLIVEKACNF